MKQLVILLAALAALSAQAGTVITTPAKSSPESISVAPDGSLILSSASSPRIFRAKPGMAEAETFIDSTADGNTGFLGVLADPASNTLWACQFTRPAGSKNRQSTLRGYDLASGASKFRWALPGDNNLCNDFAVGPDGALYVTDTNGGRIFRVKPGAAEGELLMEDRLLDGVDGIAFLGGALYVNNVATNMLYCVRDGKLQPIALDLPVNGPDGMRAANGKIFLGENRGGRADMIEIKGDQGHVTVLIEGLGAATAIDPGKDVLWVGDRANDKALAIPLP